MFTSRNPTKAMLDLSKIGLKIIIKRKSTTSVYKGYSKGDNCHFLFNASLMTAQLKKNNGPKTDHFPAFSYWPSINLQYL